MIRFLVFFALPACGKKTRNFPAVGTEKELFFSISCKRKKANCREMMLVDYASSDEEEELVKEEPPESSAIPNCETPNHENRPPPAPQNLREGRSSNQQAKSSFDQWQPSMVKLPDASLLLNSPASSSHLLDSDHSSRVAAAMAENASRKRTSNESASTYPRNKVPKGTLPHMRNLPDTAGGLLCPPQLAGRSNVVTEDINKLFVRRPANPSSK